MAEQCSNCGRSDLMQPLVRTYQCLACGATTDMATHQEVVTSPQPAQVSATGAPIIEMDKGTIEAPANEYRPPTPVDPPAPEPVVLVAPEPVPVPQPVAEVTPAPVVEDHGPEFIDLSVLTPEQVAAIESIAHPEV